MSLRLALLASVAVTLAGAAGPPMDFNCTVHGGNTPFALDNYAPNAFGCKDKLSRQDCYDLFSSTHYQPVPPAVPAKAGDLAPWEPGCFYSFKARSMFPNGIVKDKALEYCPNFCGFCCQVGKTG